MARAMAKLGELDSKFTQVKKKSGMGLTTNKSVNTKDIQKKAVAGSGQTPPKPPKKNLNKKK